MWELALFYNPWRIMKLKVDPPYHFGWKHEDDGGGTIQEVSLDRDTCIYKNEEQWMTCLLLKEREEKWEKIDFVKEKPRNKTSDTEFFMFGPDAM